MRLYSVRVSINMCAGVLLRLNTFLLFLNKLYSLLIDVQAKLFFVFVCYVLSWSFMFEMCFCKPCLLGVLYVLPPQYLTLILL